MRPFDILTIWSLLFVLCVWFWVGAIYLVSGA